MVLSVGIDGLQPAMYLQPWAYDGYYNGPAIVKSIYGQPTRMVNYEYGRLIIVVPVVDRTNDDWQCLMMRDIHNQPLSTVDQQVSERFY